MITLKLYELGKLCETITTVQSFCGTESSGSFGLWPNAERLVSCLLPGIVTIRRANAAPLYLGMMEAFVTFDHNILTIISPRIVRSDDYAFLLAQYQQELNIAVEALQMKRQSHRQLDEAMMRRLLQLQGHLSHA